MTALWACTVGQKGEGLVRVLFWLLVLAHVLAPAFQKLSNPRYLVDQRDFYLHVKLHLCGLEIPAFRVATTSGHFCRFYKLISPSSTVHPVHYLSCPSSMQVWHRDCLPPWGCGEGAVRAACRHSSQGGWRCSPWGPLASKHIAQRQCLRLLKENTRYSLSSPMVA